jgi:y4mF family transcriptional regulator
MEVSSVKNISDRIRNRRKSLNLTQVDCAAFCGVGIRFLSDLENGKESLHLGKVLQVMKMLGLKLHISENGAEK